MDKNPRQITRLRYLDAKNLEKFVKSISYDSNTNTFEIGTNLYVDGLIQNPYFILPSNGEGMKILNDTLISFYLAGENTDSIDILPQIDEGLITFAANHRLDDGSLESSEAHLNIIYAQNSDILTNQNVKTLFGNQSIYGSGNIDLYKHNVTINNQYHCTIISSSNVDCTSTTGASQKLKELLKVNNNNQYYESIYDDASGNSGIFYYYNNLLSIESNGGIVQITTITDVVTTI